MGRCRRCLLITIFIGAVVSVDGHECNIEDVGPLVPRLQRSSGDASSFNTELSDMLSSVRENVSIFCNSPHIKMLSSFLNCKQVITKKIMWRRLDQALRRDRCQSAIVSGRSKLMVSGERIIDKLIMNINMQFSCWSVPTVDP